MAKDNPGWLRERAERYRALAASALDRGLAATFDSMARVYEQRAAELEKGNRPLP
jgi:hypothetical protein